MDDLLNNGFISDAIPKMNDKMQEMHHEDENIVKNESMRKIG